MTPSPAQDNDLEALLSADDESAKPEAEESAAEEPQPEEPAEEAPKSEGKPAQKPKPATAGAPQRNGGWKVWALIVLLLLATVIGVCWYAIQQRMQVKDLKDQLETAKTQATSMETTAGRVANDLLPLVEEQLAIAKIREAAGDAEGAKYARLLAERYAGMAEKLAGRTPSGKLSQLKAEIEQAGTAAPSPATEAPSSEGATTTPEAPAPEAEATTPAPEAGTGTAPAPAAPEAPTPAPAAPTTPEGGTTTPATPPAGATGG